ncbi:hypothetical protein [Brevibacillus borstelensis]|uniref:hypothetical protein n=1 Tax=Brevibacillus borstelensis TaxID=45462 RepID=UPI00287F4261|nr:hypothetical protein [Brevibacillus borstelensis]MED1876758.1 hypothetical protein [Brevibacillus borstelensis]WNF05382.1 hypothetical protein RFB14_24085 [Brevibacillus borstelensis]
MKHNVRGIILLALVLLGSIICTQYTVNMYFAERYEVSVMLSAVNLLLFPLAYMIYRRERGRE